MVGDEEFRKVVYNKKKKEAKEYIYYEPLCVTCIHRWSPFFCGQTKHGRYYEDEKKKKKIKPYRMDGLFECDAYKFKEWSEEETMNAKKRFENFQKTASANEEYEVKRSFFDELFDDEGEYDDPWADKEDD